MNALQSLVDRVGRPGVGGLLAALAALLLWLAWGLPLERQRDALQASLQALAAAPPEAAVVVDATPDEQLSRFHAGFPTLAQAPDSIGQLQAAARRAGLVLSAGEYRLDVRPGDRLQRYAVQLPLRGTYAKLRRFIDAVLVELPHAALDDLELRRDDEGSTELEARLRLTLYLRSEP